MVRERLIRTILKLLDLKCLKRLALFQVTWIFLFMITTAPAHANIGLPMLVIVWPLFWFAFIPIVIIEYLVMIKTLNTNSRRSILNATCMANLCSTAIGLPIAWFFLVLIETVFSILKTAFSGLPEFWEKLWDITLGAAWLEPYESEFYWMIPTACAVLFVPFYFMSAWVESKVVAAYLEDPSPIDEIKNAVWEANRASYAFLYIVIIGWLIYGVSTRGLPFY